MAWCSKFEMDSAGCSHCRGHDDRPEKVPATGPEFEALHPGICGHCEEKFDRGTVVCAAMVDGERVWAIAHHTTR